MKHEEFQAWLVLSIYDELSQEERAVLERHLAECPECRRELSELRSLPGRLAEASGEVHSEVLRRSRRRLFRRLENKSPLDWRRESGWLPGIVSSNLGYAGGALALILVGLLGGYLLFSASPDFPGGWSEMDPFTGRLDVFDVRFREVDTEAGQVELSFYAARRFSVRGQVTDSHIRKILVYALLNEENPGTRLRAVNTLGRKVHEGEDQGIQAAFISALKMDDNPAVRQKALDALRRYPMSQSIEDALLYVLVNDENPRLRIEAIESLEESISRRQAMDVDIRRILQDRIQEDSNDYVRLRAQAILREIN